MKILFKKSLQEHFYRALHLITYRIQLFKKSTSIDRKKNKKLGI